MPAVLPLLFFTGENVAALNTIFVGQSAEQSGGIAEEFYRNFIEGGRYMWLLDGLLLTLFMSAMAALIGMIIGLILSVIRVSYRAGVRIPILNALAGAYIAVIRGTPVMVQLLIIYFSIFGNLTDIPPVLVAGLAFGINSGGYMAEIFRAGIESIGVGQTEAGRSLGLSYGQTMRRIILPQAIRNVLPTMFNEFITLLKETSVAGFIAVDDLTRAGNNIRSKTWSNQPLYAVALIYLVLVLGLTRLLSVLEKRMRRSDRRATGTD
ncbi:MAG: amino acid ABC transporter permease [Clostridiaceae bacterium]|nr:amino acid ABC transporter permease [Clostridiaceae bacterium]